MIDWQCNDNICTINELIALQWTTWGLTNTPPLKVIIILKNLK